jgi:hypothetical protein
LVNPLEDTITQFLKQRIEGMTSYAQICVEMDSRKGFMEKLILKGENYYWTQKINYEHVSFHCSACFQIGNLVGNDPKGRGKLGRINENQPGGLE